MYLQTVMHGSNGRGRTKKLKDSSMSLTAVKATMMLVVGDQPLRTTLEATVTGMGLRQRKHTRNEKARFM